MKASVQILPMVERLIYEQLDATILDLYRAVLKAMENPENTLDGRKNWMSSGDVV